MSPEKQLTELLLDVANARHMAESKRDAERNWPRGLGAHAPINPSCARGSRADVGAARASGAEHLNESFNNLPCIQRSATEA
jgi:hypothetical protein